MRIQILPLPAVMVGDDLEEPFALVVDQCRYDDPNLMSPHVADVMARRWREFAQECGARSVIITDETVEVVDGYAEAPAVEPSRTHEVRLNVPGVDPERVAREMCARLGRCQECGKRPCTCSPEEPPSEEARV
ncbi:hypothetical protein FH608_046235 [Nonomuraea phyllanthi]|uniref:Uncharacterized protein n=1 Tax=Nonomuraea phyllanthi TaxID=2219224 RepID=A0A5C4V6S6_9ACTN|nr:hypothetical protein [Nonomuraea phyllanthi]KAB8186894.1 hypothetical protein FH608_046235 [Nonomuraea phyllanthi]